jgi:hypothetical protein
MVTERKPIPVPYSVLLPKPLPDLPTDLPMSVTKKDEIAKPAAKKPKAKTVANPKGKKNARLISHMARNKSRTPTHLELIMVSEDSYSEIECFLANEYPYSEGLCDKPAYDFVKNLPPCLRDDPNFPAIKIPRGTLGDSSKPSSVQPAVPPCDQCGLWLERYYLDVSMLQSRIHALEDQVANLTSHDAKVQPTDKKRRTTGSILFKNVESATTIVNSKLTYPQQPRWYNFHPFIWHFHKLCVHHRPTLLHKHALLYITRFGKSNFVIGFGFDSVNHIVDLIVLN